MLLDLKYALSQLRRNIGITCPIVLAMAIGVAVATGIYAIVNGVLIRPLPYRDQERLVVLWESTKDTPRFVVAPANFLDWKRQSATFSDMTAIRQFKERSFAMTGAGDPEEFDGVRVTWNVFASRPPDRHGECSRQCPRRYACLASERLCRSDPLQENSAWPPRR